MTDQLPQGLEAIYWRAGEYAMLAVTKVEYRNQARFDELAHQLAVDAIRLTEYVLRQQEKP
jgi:hypothetical protein